MKNKTIILAYSGGLDTSFCLKKLSTDGFDVHAILVNTGGFDKQELNKIKKQAIQLGASKFVSIDGKQQFYNKLIKFLIFGNVLKNNSYPLSVSSERIIQAIEIINYSKKNNINTIAHGSTGAGNDQVRFDSIFQILNPHVKIITPIRDNNISRKQEISYLKKMGVNFTWNNSKYSINKGIWGTTIGGDETLTSYKALPNKAFTKKLIERRKKVLNVKFLNGEIVSINNKRSNPIDLINYLEKISSQYAIGRDIHVGDTIIGIKGRVGFEAAAPILIIKAHHLLEKHTLTKWQLIYKEQLCINYGLLLHEGQYLDPVMRDIEEFLISSQKNVSGDVFIKLKPYRYELVGIKSKFDLMDSKFGNYGEMNKKWSADEVKGFIKILSNQNKIYQKINKND